MNQYQKEHKVNFIIQIVFFFVLVAVDQLTKLLAVNNLKDKNPVVLIKDIIEFRYLENTGAAYGVFQNKMIFFYIITVIVFAAIVFVWINTSNNLKTYIALNESDSSDFKIRTFKSAEFFGYLLAALAAGAIGNFIDRVANGYVVDFIYFKFINFPIFNFADICVTVSVVIICIFFIFIYKEDKNFKFAFKNKKTDF